MTALRKKKKHSWLHYLLMGLLICLGIEALVLVSGMVENSSLVYRNPKSSAFIRRYQSESGEDISLRWQNLDSISDNLKRAVLVSEDDSFFSHEGVDIKELKASWETNLKKHRSARGGSTITMQLVKNLYFSKAKNPLRKLNEIILSFDIEKKLSKERILEIYLNVVEWGKGIYGAENASRFYFNKSAKDLNTSEAAYLAAILPNPIYLTSKGSRRAQSRKNRILRRMAGRTLPATL